MIEINKLLKLSFIIFCIFFVRAESKILSIGKLDAKVTIKVFSSLTCPHCANFHNEIFENLKRYCLEKL